MLISFLTVYLITEQLIVWDHYLVSETENRVIIYTFCVIMVSYTTDISDNQYYVTVPSCIDCLW